ncbi:hypothetical protein M885DRAFT_591431 [Pelagophyceae sp. CCMP2097]|nr:hypothetical protein M885DRAFT_591431 [Pelagophyceae sp. CCMP2097]
MSNRSLRSKMGIRSEDGRNVAPVAEKSGLSVAALEAMFRSRVLELAPVRRFVVDGEADDGRIRITLDAAGSVGCVYIANALSAAEEAAILEWCDGRWDAAYWHEYRYATDDAGAVNNDGTSHRFDMATVPHLLEGEQRYRTTRAAVFDEGSAFARAVSACIAERVHRIMDLGLADLEAAAPTQASPPRAPPSGPGLPSDALPSDGALPSDDAPASSSDGGDAGGDAAPSDAAPRESRSGDGAAPGGVFAWAACRRDAARLHDEASGALNPSLARRHETLRDELVTNWAAPESMQVTRYFADAASGMGQHFDSRLNYGAIVTASLRRRCALRLTRGAEEASVQLAPRSVYALTGPARGSCAAGGNHASCQCCWMHGVRVHAHGSATVGDRSEDYLLKYRRVGLTLRSLTAGAKAEAQQFVAGPAVSPSPRRPRRLTDEASPASPASRFGKRKRKPRASRAKVRATPSSDAAAARPRATPESPPATPGAPSDELAAAHAWLTQSPPQPVAPAAAHAWLTQSPPQPVAPAAAHAWLTQSPPQPVAPAPAPAWLTQSPLVTQSPPEPAAPPTVSAWPTQAPCSFAGVSPPWLAAAAAAPGRQIAGSPRAVPAALGRLRRSADGQLYELSGAVQSSGDRDEAV